MAPSWDDVTDELARRLPLLRDGDAVSLDVGDHFVQVKRFGPVIAVIASGSGPELAEAHRVSPDQAARMVALGWRPPGPDVTHSLPDVPRPISADTSRQIATLLVTTARDVYGAATPAQARFRSHTDGNHRPPTLTTVAMAPD